jgi:hypothetical protein
MGHGQVQTPQDIDELREARIKLEIIVYAFIIALGMSTTPVYLIPEMS